MINLMTRTLRPVDLVFGKFICQEVEGNGGDFPLGDIPLAVSLGTSDDSTSDLPGQGEGDRLVGYPALI